ncbi:transposase [Thermococcus sp.]|uniref:transposase n=1 Tax=Thermococcus sp. TaxID=35749 RepID=UPI00262FC745|nr:transposase [Thermococcus sp.]
MKRPALVFLALLLMMYLYPLSIVPLFLLAGEWEEFRKEWLWSAIVVGLSFPLYGAKILLGISGWAKVLGITPLQVSPQIWWSVYLTFTALQMTAVYFIYRVSKNLGRYGIAGGLLMLSAVPLHILSLNLYFALTWAGLLLFLFALKTKGGD